MPDLLGQVARGILLGVTLGQVPSGSKVICLDQCPQLALLGHVFFRFDARNLQSQTIRGRFSRLRTPIFWLRNSMYLGRISSLVRH